MAKYKIWARVYVGNHQWDEEEMIEEFDDTYDEFDIDRAIEDHLWYLLTERLNVETGYEKIEE
jgi:hypothetical protein